ncbi:hypothetical protein D039_2978A, partial [Vibrio parahaemolyticus EKP-028]
MIENFIWFDK